MLDVEEKTRITRANLVEKNRAVALNEDYGAVLGNGELRVLEDQSNKMTLRDRLAETFAHYRRAEIGKAAIGHDHEVAKERFLVRLVAALGRRANTSDSVVKVGLNERSDCRLDNIDTGRLLRCVAQIVDELAVVKAATFSARRVWNVHRFVLIDHAVSLDGNGVYSLQSGLQAKVLQRVNASRLQKFADDPIWFLQRAFKYGDSERFVALYRRKCMCESAASDTTADDDNVVVLVPHC